MLCACTPGQRSTRGWNQAYHARGRSKTPWARVGERCDAQCHQGSGSVRLGELPPAGMDTAIAEINKKTDFHVEIESLEKLGTRVNALNFSIKTQEFRAPNRAVPCPLFN